MQSMNFLITRYSQTVADIGRADFLAPLLLRLYLAPVFWMAGWNKLAHFEDTAAWFGDGLGLPLPTLMAGLAIAAELGTMKVTQEIDAFTTMGPWPHWFMHPA